MKGEKKYREALVSDIPRIQVIRHLVKENRLSDPARVTDKDCEEYITQRGKGWVCEINNEIVGFAIVDCKDHNIWALFIQPEFEGQGIGRKLQELMLDWYFTQSNATLWLGTAPGTRAEEFYRKAGWTDKGLRPNAEIRFEMTLEDHKSLNGKLL